MILPLEKIDNFTSKSVNLDCISEWIFIERLTSTLSWIILLEFGVLLFCSHKNILFRRHLPDDTGIILFILRHNMF